MTADKNVICEYNQCQCLCVVGVPRNEDDEDEDGSHAELKGMSCSNWRNPKAIFLLQTVCCVLCGSSSWKQVVVCVSVRKSRKSLLKAIYNSIQKLSIVGGVSKSHVSHISLIDKYIYLNIYIFKATCCVCSSSVRCSCVLSSISTQKPKRKSRCEGRPDSRGTQTSIRWWMFKCCWPNRRFGAGIVKSRREGCST